MNLRIQSEMNIVMGQRPPAKPEAWNCVNRSKRVSVPLSAQSGISPMPKLVYAAIYPIY